MFSLVLTTFSVTSLNSPISTPLRKEPQQNQLVSASNFSSALLSFSQHFFLPPPKNLWGFWHTPPPSPAGLPTAPGRAPGARPLGGGSGWDRGGPGVTGRDPGERGAAAPGAEPSPPARPPLLSARCLHFSCLFPSPYPVSFWAANFNLKLDWADLMQIPPGKTLKLMNSYVKSILHHREKVTSARKKNNKVKETRAFHV